MKQIYSEEEFKIVLKNLFAEKNRVQELQKKLHENAQDEKDSQEVLELKEKLEKIKPVVQQLMGELKTAKENQGKLQDENDELFKENSSLLEEKKKQEHLLLSLQSQKNKTTTEALDHEWVKNALEEKRNLEEERQKLIERLASTLTELHAQSEMNKQMREEILSLSRELKNEQFEKKQYLEEHSKERLSENLEKKIQEMEQNKEEILTQSYEALKRLTKECSQLQEEKGAFEKELKKAHQHLGKKIKENALLKDAYDRQRAKISELQSLSLNRKIEIENLHQTINYQRSHEKKVDLLTQEKIASLETLLKESLERQNDLQKEISKQKEEILLVEKIKKTHEKLSQTCNTIKEILNNLSLDG